MPSYLPNQCCPTETLYCGGQPSPDQLAAFAGVCPDGCVINLRPASETGDGDEASLVRALGLDYVHIPVAGPEDLTPAAAQALATALQRHADGRVLVHCASGQRVAALLALKAAWIDRHDAAQALAMGHAAGLTALEPHVRARLAE
jgi:uncharacterized protein (TIGR01244 family)